MKYIQKLIAFGYLLIALLIGCIAYIWFYEWRIIENLEADNRLINKLKKDVNNIHVQLIEFYLLGETILEWDDEDLEHCHVQYIAMDSMPCHFKSFYPAGYIDSVRYLLKDKE